MKFLHHLSHQMELWQLLSNRFLDKNWAFCYWSSKHKPHPQTHTIGWATVAMSGWSGFSNKKSNVLKSPQCLQMTCLRLSFHIKLGYENAFYIYTLKPLKTLCWLSSLKSFSRCYIHNQVWLMPAQMHITKHRCLSLPFSPYVLFIPVTLTVCPLLI